MRTHEHIVDTKAVKNVLYAIPDHWVVRELTERDYGIDLMVEIFVQDGLDNNNRPRYTPTGSVCYFQIKGTDSAKASYKFSLKKSFLENVAKHSVSFFLVRVFNERKENDKCLFVWLQEYMRTQLPVDWLYQDKKSISITIPKKNILHKTHNENIDRICEIAHFPKYIEEFHIFEELFFKNPGVSFMHHINQMQEFGATTERLEEPINILNRIQNLKLLFQYNHAQCSLNGDAPISDSITTLTNCLIELRDDPQNQTEINNLNQFIDDFYNNSGNINLLVYSTYYDTWKLTVENNGYTLY